MNVIINRRIKNLETEAQNLKAEHDRRRNTIKPMSSLHYVTTASHLSSKIKVLKELLTEIPSIVTYWDFIEENYPNYSSSDEILLSDILNRFLDNEEICESDRKMIDDIGTKEEVQEFFIQHETKLFEEALRNSLKENKNGNI